MPTPIDYLSAPEFADDRLTDAINVPPYVTGRLAQLGLFVDTPIATTYAKLAIREDEITIIPARERGGESNKNMRQGHGETMIPIPHFPLDDAITPADVQNILVYGEEYVLQTLLGVYNEKLTTMRAKHDLTHSHLDWGAIRGLVIDGEGKVLVDLYDQFSITQDVIEFALGSETTDAGAASRSVKASIRKDMRGTPFSEVRVLASPEWFDAYVNHESVREAYRYRAAGPNPAADDIGDEFRHAGLVIERIDEEYPFRQPDNTFDLQDAIPAGEAIALPMGTPFFKRYIAPPDTILDANRAPNPAQKLFLSTDTRPHGKGEEIHTESNVLPICQRPALIKRLTSV